MENNGPANIKMLVDIARDDMQTNRNGTLPQLELNKLLCNLDKEADNIIKYLTAINEVLKKHGIEKEIPFWHEVKDDSN